MSDNGVDQDLEQQRSTSRTGRRWAALLVALTVASAGAVAVVVAPAASAATVDTSASYVLVNRNSGKALDVYDKATTDGARITQWTRNDGTNQQWQFVDSGGWLLPDQVQALGQGPRRRQLLDRRRWPDRAVGRRQRHQPAVAAAGHHERLRPADQPQQRQGPRGPGRVHRRRRQHRAVQRLGRHQPAVAARPGRRRHHADQPAHHRDLHQPGGLAGLRRRRHHPRRRRVLLLGVDHALLARGAHPALLRPGELGVRRPLGAPTRLRRRRYDLTGGRAYVKGIWASTLNYRPSNSTYYWLGCIEFNRTYVYTSTAVDGTWSKKARINNCYYDAGLLIDDNDTMYVAYGNSTISVAQLSPTAPPRCARSRSSRRRRASAPSRARGSTSAAATTTSGSPGRPTASTCCGRQPRGARTRCAGAAQPARPDLRRRRAAPGRPGADPERRLVLHGLHRRLPGRPGPDARRRSPGARTAGPSLQTVNGRWGTTYTDAEHHDDQDRRLDDRHGHLHRLHARARRGSGTTTRTPTGSAWATACGCRPPP